jgi:hypothetical protein
MAELKGDYRRFMDKNFFGVWDLDPDGDTVLTIDHTSRDEVQNERGKETKFTIHWSEDKKPLICNKTNAESISKALGTKMVEEWKGKRIALYSKQVPAFGGITDAVRVRDYPPKEVDVICEDCGKKITDHDGFSVNKIVTRSEALFGKKYCWDCSIKHKEEKQK